MKAISPPEEVCQPVKNVPVVLPQVAEEVFEAKP